MDWLKDDQPPILDALYFKVKSLIIPFWGFIYYTLDRLIGESVSYEWKLSEISQYLQNFPHTVHLFSYGLKPT